MSLRRTLAYAVLVAAAVVYLYPFVIQVATSLKTDPDASTNPLSLLPHPLSTQAWGAVLGSGDSQLPVLRWLTNSVVVTVAVTAGRVFFDSLAGYALSRLHFRGRGAVFALVLAVSRSPASPCSSPSSTWSSTSASTTPTPR